MTTRAHIAGFQIKYAANDSPSSYQTIEEVLSVGGLGVTADTLDVTNFSSPEGQKEFIAALFEGNALTVECNDINGTVQRAMDTAAATGVNQYFRAIWTKTSPNRNIKFVGAITGVEYTPSVSEQNKTTFTVKISGWKL
jgi:hypothetical protein